MTVCELDECENPTRRGARFCSRTHGYAGQGRPGRARGEKCAAGLHPMSGENLRVDKRGHRSCRACAGIAEAKRKGRVPGAGRPKARPRKVPVPRPAPVVPAVERAPWRPASWGPAPMARRDAS